MRLILFLDLCVDTTFARGFVELPFGHLEEISRLAEAHLPAANHVDRVLERLVLGQFAAVDGDALVL